MSVDISALLVRSPLAMTEYHNRRKNNLFLFSIIRDEVTWLTTLTMSFAHSFK